MPAKKKAAAAAGDDTISAPATATDFPVIDASDQIAAPAPPTMPPASTDADHDGHDDSNGQFVEGNREAAKPKLKAAATIARIVHFYQNSAAEPQAAIITGLNGDLVHLTIFTLGGPKLTFDIPYVDEIIADGPAWRWPPGVTGLPTPTLANIGNIETHLLGATGHTAFGVAKTELRAR